MNKVKCERISDGRVPSEKIAHVLTADGVEEEVFVGPEQTQDGYVFLPEVYTEQERVLVELPQESSSGRWRLWISRNQIENGA